MSDPIGSGGQGSVYRVPGNPRLVEKIYAPNLPVNFHALNEMVQWRLALEPTFRNYLDAICTWPLETVRTPGVGFRMNALPDDCYQVSPGGVKVELTLNMLYRSPREADKHWRWRPKENREKLNLLITVVEMVNWLHSLGLIIGDFSQKNVLLAPNRMQCMFIDCDSWRFLGKESAVPAGDANDWRDEFQLQFSHPPSQDSDCYKIMLLVMRTILSNEGFGFGSIGELTEGQVLTLETFCRSLDLKFARHELMNYWKRCLTYGQRPTAFEILNTLKGL
jgi:hypothetical protein